MLDSDVSTLPSESGEKEIILVRSPQENARRTSALEGAGRRRARHTWRIGCSGCTYYKNNFDFKRYRLFSVELIKSLKYINMKEHK